MNTEHVHDLLPAYVDGGITDATLWAAIELHLEGCATCRAERDATARAMARIGGIIRGAGNGVAVPDVRWINGRVQRAQPFLKPRRPVAGQRPGGDHHRRSQKPMKSNIQPRRDGRGIGAIAGAITFALLIVMLVAAAAAFSIVNAPRNAIGPTDEGAITAAVADSTTITAVPITSTATPTQTPSPTPTLDPAVGGFVENALDVSGLPEYVLPLYGSPGYSGNIDCDQGKGIPESQTVATLREPEFEAFWLTPAYLSKMWMVCLYNIPDTSPGAKLTVRLTSPSGKVFSREYTIWEANTVPEPPMAITVNTQHDRNPIFVHLEFQAGQEYGEWLVEGISSDGRIFASGPLIVDAPSPVYSVSLPDDPLDPFILEPPYMIEAGQHVVFSARGLKAGREFILAVYSEDPELVTEDTRTWVPRFASRVTVADDGSLRSEFMIGANTQEGQYSFFVDPEPDRIEGASMYVFP